MYHFVRVIAVEEAGQPVHEASIFLGGDLSDARPGALLDVEQEARAAPRGVILEFAVRTGADRKRLQKEIERVADGVGVGERPKVLVAFPSGSATHPGGRPFVSSGQRQERIALVVPEANVETRSVLLDERVLEHERLDLVVGDDEVDRVGGVHHGSGSLRHVPVEVAQHSLAEGLGLPHIEDLPVHVAKLVGAWCIRDFGGRGAFHPNRVYRGSVSSFPGDADEAGQPRVGQTVAGFGCLDLSQLS